MEELETFRKILGRSASVAVSSFPDEIQRSYSLRKATVLKLSKPFSFNLAFSESVATISEKYLCGGNKMGLFPRSFKNIDRHNTCRFVLLHFY